MSRQTSLAPRDPRRRAVGQGMVTALIFGITLSACGDSDAPAQRSRPTPEAGSGARTDGLFRSQPHAPAIRRATAKAARRGRAACSDKLIGQVLSASLADSTGADSPGDFRLARNLARVAHRLSAEDRRGGAGASVASALYALRFPRVERSAARAGCMLALRETVGGR